MPMKSVIASVMSSAVILCACAAVETARKPVDSSGWSSTNPFSIPYGTRLAQLEKGNLVPNPSFEEGRAGEADGGNRFKLRGWDAVGQNVRWIQPESGSDDIAEVNSGRHAVKIERKTAGELDAAEGIISDYIPVIPGNYFFTYHVRLKDIVGNRYRLGVRLCDTVSVRVFYFDKDKAPVEPGAVNPLSGTRIDTSDKSYSFSNYWRIDDFPWGPVRGKSYNYPFSEGDIPDRTRYVRLFFGLKGTGTMWLDDIDFRYSKWNFTALERLEPYFDRTLTPAERIIPAPKYFEQLNDIIYYRAGSPIAGLPVIVLPQNPAPAERAAADLLQKKIGAVLDRVIPAQPRHADRLRIFTDIPSVSALPEAALIFSIGRNRVYDQVQPDLSLRSVRNKEQGYVIWAEAVDRRQIVFLMGDTPLANYYAAATAIQLFEDDACVYHNAIVIDEPDFLSRAYAFKHWQNNAELKNDLINIERMSLYKMNRVYVGYVPADNTGHYGDSLYLDGITAAGEACRQSGLMRLAVMANPYSHFPFEPAVGNLSESARYAWTHSSAQSFDRLRNFYKLGLEAGADTIMLLADDRVPHTGKNPQHYSLYTPEDKARFINLQNAQAHVINRLKQWIDAEYPGTRLEFCPPWYANEFIDRGDGRAEVYFEELIAQIPRDVAVVWTGPTVRSLSVDMADLQRYRALIGRWPMFWDNTLYARTIETERYGGYTTHYPGKVRMCNLFEPFDAYRPPDFQDYNDRRQIYTNANAYSDFYRIKLATMADYQWNTRAYQPELSLWKSLCGAYGQESAKMLLRFNDAYYGLYEVCLRIEREGRQDVLIAAGRNFLNDLDSCLERISAQLPDEPALINALEKLRTAQQLRFDESNRDQQKALRARMPSEK